MSHVSDDDDLPGPGLDSQLDAALQATFPASDPVALHGAYRRATSSAAGDVAEREVHQFGVPWEREFGYAQAVRIGRTIYVSGQLSHDADGTLVAPAPLDATGRVLDASTMAAQMRCSYANAARLLASFGASLANVVEEVLYVLDMDAAYRAGIAVRREAYGTAQPAVACTLITTPRLALPGQLIEIRFVAVV